MRRAEVLGSEIGANCGCFGLLRAFGGGLGGIGVFVDARGRFPAAANGRFEGAGGVLPANPADRRGAEGRAGMTLRQVGTGHCGLTENNPGKLAGYCGDFRG